MYKHQLRLNKAVELLKDNDVMYDFICPQCLTLNNMNKDGYQMNDIVEVVFCSLECSHAFNLDYKDEFLKLGYNEIDLEDLA